MPHPASDNPLRGVLAGLAQRRRRRERLASALRAVGPAVAALLGVVLVDAVWPLAPLGRGLGALLVVALPVVLAWRRRGATRAADAELTREARGVEQLLGWTDNVLINGLGLQAQAAAAPASLTRTLAQRACTQADAAVARAPRQLPPSRSLRRQGVLLAAVSLVAVVIGLAQPDLLTGGLARLGDPLGDHPPFSLTKLTVRVAPPTPRPGDDVRVEVRVAGLPATGAELVEVDGSGADRGRWPMARLREGVYERRLLALREPTRVYVQAGGARSRSLLIEPRRVTGEWAAGAPALPSPPTPTPSTAAGGAGAGAGQGVVRDADLLAVVGQLADDAARLERAAAELAQRLEGAAEPLSAWAQASLEDVDWRLTSLAGNARAAEEAAAARAAQLAAGGDSEGLRQALGRLRGALQKLESTRVARLPQPVGGGGVSEQGRTQWVGAVRQAAARDSAAVIQQLSGLRAVLGTGAAVAPPAPDPAQTAPAPAGPAVETAAGGGAVARGEAWVSKVPPAYRELTGQYFDRIARDQERRQP